MTHLPSPASASSSTLIVTPLPSKDSIQFDVLPPGTANTRPRVTITTTPIVQSKMSANGFVQPHHSHMPRRSKPNSQVKIAAGSINRTTNTSAATSAVVDPSSPVTAEKTSSSPHTNPQIQTPPSKFPSRLYLPLHDQTPPTHLLSLKLPPTPVVGSAPGTASLGYTTAALGSAPAFSFHTPGQTQVQTPRGNLQPTSANLPRRTSKKLGLGHGQTRWRGLTSATAPALGGAVHSSASTASSASPSHSPTPAAAVSMARSRPPAAVDGAEPSTSARVLVSAGTRGRGASLPQLMSRVGRSPSQSQSQSGKPASVDLDFDSNSRRAAEVGPVRIQDRDGKGKLVRTVERLQEEDETSCIQEVGRGSGIEVGFLDDGVDEDGVDDFWGLRADAEVGTRVEEDEKRQERLRRVVLRVVESYSSSEEDEREEDRPDQGSCSTTGPTTSTWHSIPPTLELELELDLPSDLKSYKDGETALTDDQIRTACAFIGGHLGFGNGVGLDASTSSNTRTAATATDKRTRKQQKPRKRIRILCPRARPEEAMSFAVCYLAYFRDLCSSSSSTTTSTSSTTTSSSSSSNKHALDADANDDDDAWQRSLTPAHLLWMRLMDAGDGSDTRGRGLSVSVLPADADASGEANRRVFVGDLHRLSPRAVGGALVWEGGQRDADVDVDDDRRREKREERGERGEGMGGDEYRGVRDEWRGVLSFDGLARVDVVGAGAGGVEVDVRPVF